MTSDHLTDQAKTLLASLPRDELIEVEDGQMLLRLAEHNECRYIRISSTLGRFEPNGEK